MTDKTIDFNTEAKRVKAKSLMYGDGANGSWFQMHDVLVDDEPVGVSLTVQCEKRGCDITRTFGVESVDKSFDNLGDALEALGWTVTRKTDERRKPTEQGSQGGEAERMEEQGKPG